MKSFINFLPPWVETNIQPAFYDKESGTCLQQTARMYAKVNQLIRHFNCLAKETKETVEEYIAKFVELKDFVDTYFENLDVQEEINNKLDQMTEDGTLQEIIADYLSMGAVWGYDSVADMKSATNLTDGSSALTKGYYTPNDGGSALYHITDTTPTGFYETLDNGLYAELIADEINVKQVGLKGDGVTDEWSKFKALLDSYAGTKIHVLFPEGLYRFEKHNEYLTLPTYTILEGDNSAIFFNDTESAGTSLFNGANGELTIKGLKFKSTFDTITSQTNTALLYYSTSNDASVVTIDGCKFESFRGGVFTMANCDRLNITNSEYYNVGRDCNRFLNARYSCVTGCKFELCGDDVVSCHGDVTNSEHIFANNKVTLSLGCAYLGGKYIDIHDNSFINPIMIFKAGRHNTEGGDTEVINFHDNYVLQPIKLSGNTGDRLTWFGNGTKKIKFNNNTMKDGNLTTVSRLNIVGVVHVDPQLGKGHFVLASLDSSYTHEYLQFNGNYSDIKTGPETLHLGNTRFISGVFAKLDMFNNTIENFYSNLATQAQSKISWNVRDNYFNGDKEHLLTTDGTWANSSVLRVFNPYPNNFENNTLRNISGNYGLVKSNKVLYQNDGKYMNPISNASPSEFIPYDESTGVITNSIQSKGPMPTSGYYHAGTYVWTNFSNANSPIGWYRATTGNTHVLNTDWIPLYVSNAPIA